MFLLCVPGSTRAGTFIAFSFIHCHALSGHVIISITEPAVHVKLNPTQKTLSETWSEAQWEGNFSQGGSTRPRP